MVVLCVVLTEHRNFVSAWMIYFHMDGPESKGL